MAARLCLILLSLAEAAGGAGGCGAADPKECHDVEASLLQRVASLHQRDLAVSGRRGPTATRSSDIAALQVLYEANFRQETMIGWGTGDPCIGDTPEEAAANSQGFGPWKGVACAPCPADPGVACVTQIWLHQKNLNGTIPEEFKDLSELRFLKLSGNNLTGPLPTANWATFPNLVELDLSFNTINGTLPLTHMKVLRRIEVLSANDNRFNAIDYDGGGFEALESLLFMYNRGMAGTFPRELSQLPQLRRLYVHDTNLTGSVPHGPWPQIRSLILSGNGEFCGARPAACDRGHVFCDVSQDFGKCPVVLGAPLATFHNTTLWIYHEALRQLNYTRVTVVSQFIHGQLFPMFTGFGGLDDGCKEDGCSDLCRQLGLGDSPCVDFVVDSNIPINHGRFMKAYTETFDVMGTAFGEQFISLFAPDYSSFKSISGAASSRSVNKTIIGFDGGEQCRGGYCPACRSGDVPYIRGDPLASSGFAYHSFPCDTFQAVVAEKLAARDEFLVLMFYPHYWGAAFPQLRPIDLEQHRSAIRPNQGKAQVRRAARHKFDEKALSVLGAIYIGAEEMQRADGWAMGFNNDPPGPLCDYQSFNHACSREAALKWIAQNQDSGEKQGVWPTFFW